MQTDLRASASKGTCPTVVRQEMHHCRGDAGDLIVLENLRVGERKQSADILGFEKIPDVVGSDVLVSHGVDQRRLALRSAAVSDG